VIPKLAHAVRADGDGFLHQDVLSRVERALGEVDMGVGGRADTDEIHLGVLDERERIMARPCGLGIKDDLRGVGAEIPGGLGASEQSRGVRVANAREATPLHSREGAQVRLPDEPRTDDPDPD
jgi:hypothetical protein